MKHDEQSIRGYAESCFQCVSKLDSPAETETLKNRKDMLSVFTLLLTRYAEDFHKHVSQWNPIDQPPETGEWVEVLCNDMGDIHTITYGPARFRDTDKGWRPAVRT